MTIEKVTLAPSENPTKKCTGDTQPLYVLGLASKSIYSSKCWSNVEARARLHKTSVTTTGTRTYTRNLSQLHEIT